MKEDILSKDEYYKKLEHWVNQAKLLQNATACFPYYLAANYPNYFSLNGVNIDGSISTPQSRQQPSAGAGKQNRKIPSGILNPMYAKADFNLPQHPYQDVYVAPSSGYGHPQGGVWWST